MNAITNVNYLFIIIIQQKNERNKKHVRIYKINSNKRNFDYAAVCILPKQFLFRQVTAQATPINEKLCVIARRVQENMSSILSECEVKQKKCTVMLMCIRIFK